MFKRKDKQTKGLITTDAEFVENLTSKFKLTSKALKQKTEAAQKCLKQLRKRCLLNEEVNSKLLRQICEYLMRDRELKKSKKESKKDNSEDELLIAVEELVMMCERAGLDSVTKEGDRLELKEEKGGGMLNMTTSPAPRTAPPNYTQLYPDIATCVGFQAPLIQLQPDSADTLAKALTFQIKETEDEIIKRLREEQETMDRFSQLMKNQQTLQQGQQTLLKNQHETQNIQANTSKLVSDSIYEAETGTHQGLGLLTSTVIGLTESLQQNIDASLEVAKTFQEHTKTLLENSHLVDTPQRYPGQSTPKDHEESDEDRQRENDREEDKCKVKRQDTNSSTGKHPLERSPYQMRDRRRTETESDRKLRELKQERHETLLKLGKVQALLGKHKDSQRHDRKKQDTFWATQNKLQEESVTLTQTLKTIDACILKWKGVDINTDMVTGLDFEDTEGGSDSSSAVLDEFWANPDDPTAFYVKRQKKHKKKSYKKAQIYHLTKQSTPDDSDTDQEQYPLTQSSGGKTHVRHLTPPELAACRAAIRKNHPSTCGGGRTLASVLSCIPGDTMTITDLIQICKEVIPLAATRLTTSLTNYSNESVSRHLTDIKTIMSTLYPVKSTTITSMDLTPQQGETGLALASRLRQQLREMLADEESDTSIHMGLLTQTMKGQLMSESLAKIDHMDPSDESYLTALCNLRVREEEKRTKKAESASNSQLQTLTNNTIASSQAITTLCETLGKVLVKDMHNMN